MDKKTRYTLRIVPRTLHFRVPAGTSRGVYTTRQCWYVLLSTPEEPTRMGVGECAPLPDLSCDYSAHYADTLANLCQHFATDGELDCEALRPYPSIRFGLETALRHHEVGSYALWDTPFSRGEAGIPINGLIWMGTVETMSAQIAAKLEAGFGCIKLKIGAIGFADELELLRQIRRRFPAGEVELRVDANGAFVPTEAIEKLGQLAQLHIHSIEQPIAAGQWEEMAQLIAHSPLPIALDEELIGHHTPTRKQTLLDALRPHYLVLKPSLHGGFAGSEEWVAAATERGIDWWATSALESNIGLNAIAHWCATQRNPLPQGLGTGALFTDNVPMPLEVRGDCLHYTPHGLFPTFAPQP